MQFAPAAALGMGKERARLDTAALKHEHALLALAERFTRLRPISRQGEYAGPCPCCGGVDRFHVKAERWYCRQCTPRGGDVIDLVQRVYHVGFREACALLQAEGAFFSERPLPPAQSEAGTTRQDRAWQSEAYQDSARRTLAATERLLSSREGQAGFAYLRARGLTEATWRAFRLGYGRAFHPVRCEQREAIFLPWFTETGQIAAIQHRYIGAELAKHERYRLKPGSQPILFGLQALAPAQRLFVVEGEFNAMSIFQCGEQAVSVGSESNRGNRAALDILQARLPAYSQVVVWFDNPAAAQEAAGQLAARLPFRQVSLRWTASPVDANALLASGEMEEFLAAR